MIKVHLPRLSEGYYGLKQTAQSLSAQLQSAGAVRSALQGGAGLEEFRPLLDRVLAAGEEQRQELLRMAQVVDTACQYYSACENRIVDQCENAAVAYPARRAEFIRTPDTAEVLRDLGLM